MGDDATRHARRRFYEAAITSKDKVTREALFRIHKLFEFERKWSGLPPSRRKDLRNAFSRLIVEDFMAWAQVQDDQVKDRRGLLRSAFGYVVRQREAHCLFLEMAA